MMNYVDSTSIVIGCW